MSGPGTPRRGARAAVLAALLLALAPAAASARVPRGFMGMVAGAEVAHHPERVPGQVARMARNGVQSVKAEFNWARMEREEGTIDWSETDALVAAAAVRHLSLLPTVVGAPAWTSGPLATQEGVHHPRDPSDYGRFLRQLIGRYGPHGSFWTANPDISKKPIRAWEVWNEPDIPYYWHAPWVNDYVALLRSAHRAVKRADPGAKVVLAGLTNRSWDDLNRLYRAGAKPYFDVASIHPYTQRPANAVRTVRLLRDVMRRHHDAHTPVWVTELSWTSGKRHMSGTHTLQPYFLNTTPRGQAAKLRAGYLDLARARHRLNIRRIYWYTWLSQDESPNYPFDWSGLLSVHGDAISAKPALAAYRRVAHRLGG
jgi:hypothetical protein